MRIGAENSTWALFGKSFFLAHLSRKWLFFRVSRAQVLHPRARATAAPPKAHVDTYADNASILVAKSPLSTCSISGKCRDAGLTAPRCPPGAAARNRLLTRRGSR